LRLTIERYPYDAFDRRVAESVVPYVSGVAQTATTFWTAYDGDNPYADFNSSGALTSRYLYRPAVDMLLARDDASSGNVSWYLTDRLGSVRTMAQIAGTAVNVVYRADYDAFGKTSAELPAGGGDRFKYTASQFDSATGLNYNRARFYDPATGRFLNEDPSGFAGGDSNLYRYTGNDPTNETDPSGLEASGSIQNVPYRNEGGSGPATSTLLDRGQGGSKRSFRTLLYHEGGGNGGTGDADINGDPMAALIGVIGGSGSGGDADWGSTGGGPGGPTGAVEPRPIVTGPNDIRALNDDGTFVQETPAQLAARLAMGRAGAGRTDNGRDWLDNGTTLGAGYVDILSFGASKALRQYAGHDGGIDYGSSYYAGGQALGIGVGLALGGAAGAAGKSAGLILGGARLYNTGATIIGAGQAINNIAHGQRSLGDVLALVPAVGYGFGRAYRGLRAPVLRGAGRPLGARGPVSGRDFDPTKAGGAVRRLTTDRIKISSRGIDYVERHVARFGPDAPNKGMVQRLRDIEAGNLKPTQADLNFYSHELRESVRYRRLGFANGQPPDADAARELWNNTHTAALEDYLLREGPDVPYHPSGAP
jgi:RHS repeat-associated protein